MEKIAFSPAGTDLASRRSASQLRHVVTSTLNEGKKVVIDLSNVASISPSYADELFGILVLEYGIKRFFETVTVKKASTVVLRQIAEAIKERLGNDLTQETLSDLVAAKHTQQSQTFKSTR
ncbi:MAG: STAS-like domain-containing protein [Candidatus Methylumidiphilus sp.]